MMPLAIGQITRIYFLFHTLKSTRTFDHSLLFKQSLRKAAFGTHKQLIESRQQIAFREGLSKAKVILESMVDEINSYLKDESTASIPLTTDSGNLWSLLHPKIVEVSRPLFENSHYAESVLCALKEVNVILKSKVKAIKNLELDGVRLMQRTFSVDNPILKLGT